ncbi:unnamed protein product [Mytilus edulis]|uniref:Uncharacterized protein n=1 Tax=Mytilus edulis TaxID=6550 RepID=A0A8S3QZ23_MYTED|nr:unnamed protein product [Mytilus edulis]
MTFNINGTVNLNYIPLISVFIYNNNWYTTDNRRLWVFRKAEELGILSYIFVSQVQYTNSIKLTTTNDGLTVRVRRNNPGGQTWRRLSDERYTNPHQISTESFSSNRKTFRREPNISRYKYDDGSSNYFMSFNEFCPYSEFESSLEKSRQSYSRPSTYNNDHPVEKRKTSSVDEYQIDYNSNKESSTWLVLIGVAAVAALFILFEL